jgi:hypothetical protein
MSAKMSIFKEMHPYWQFDSLREFTELQRMLMEAINRGYIEEVPVMNKHPMLSTEKWYRDEQTGEIFCLVPPDFPARGSWLKVDTEDLKRSEYRTQ